MYYYIFINLNLIRFLNNIKYICFKYIQFLFENINNVSNYNFKLKKINNDYRGFNG